MEPVIDVRHLSKAFGPVKAVDDLSFQVERGSFFAFLGPNGAGKSTTIDILCTLQEADQGKVEILGRPLGMEDSQIRKGIGVVFQDSLMDSLLTLEENLRLRGSFYGLSRKELEEGVLRAAREAGAESFLKRPYGKLSGGQRRRGDIARALLHTPEILFLDEPTTGLDPQTRKSIWETLMSLRRQEGMTIFLTTHYMEEAREADYVVILDQGRIAAQGTPEALKERYTRDRLLLTPKDSALLEDLLTRKGYPCHKEGGRYLLYLKDSFQALDLVAELREALLHFEVLTGTMDDAFIAVTGKEIRE